MLIATEIPSMLAAHAGAPFSSLRELIVHVPYKSGGPAGTAVAAGEVPFGVLAASSAAPHNKTGRVKAIGVATRSRIQLGPQWPTIIEAGVPEFTASL